MLIPSSKALVKVEQNDDHSLRNRAKNDHLPASIRDRFTKIMPIIISWKAASADPWRTESADLIEALEIAGQVFAADDYELQDGKKSPEFKIVCIPVSKFPILILLQALQRLSDSWRTSIQYAAVWTLIDFFDSNSTFGKSDAKRRDWANRQLGLQRFIFSRAAGDNQKASRVVILLS